MPRIVKSPDAMLDEDYSEWIREIKRRSHRTKVSVAVNVKSVQPL